MTRLWRLAREVWVLTKGYWGSDERWSARVLLTAVIGLNLGLVGVNVLQNQANGALFTALQLRDAPAFYRAFAIVVLLIVLYLAVAVLRVYLDQTLQLRWRRWLTDQYVTRWLTDRTFYRMRFSGRVDNPDQRISEDVRLFIERSAIIPLTKHRLAGRFTHQTGAAPCRAIYRTPSFTTKTKPAHGLKHGSGRMVPSARIAAKLKMSLA